MVKKMSDDSSPLNQKQINKLNQKAKELGYQNLGFFIDDLDMLLRSANLLKEKDMKYFELENLITLLSNKKISLGMAPRMISMVSKYSERNEELENENATLKQENITLKSKYQTSDAQVKEYQKQLKDLSVAPQADAKIREENIKLIEENKYLKMTNDSLTEDFKNTKKKYETKLEEANNLEVENNQLELRVKELQRESKELEIEFEELKKKNVGSDKTLMKIEDLIEELDEIYGTIDDPFKKEFLAFFGVELSEIVDDRHLTKQKILNQIAIHANEIEKIFEPRIAALARQQQIITTAAPVRTHEPVKRETVEEKPKEESIPEPVKRQPVREEPTVDVTSEIDELAETGDRYVKPSEFLKGKSVHNAKTSEEEETEAQTDEKPTLTEEDEIPTPKPVSYPKKSKSRKATAPVDRTPSPELIKVFDVFIKYLDAINDNNSFNDLCDKFIEQMYEHVGSPGMTQVYKIKSGGVKRKKLLIDLLEQWKKELPEM